MTVRSSSASLHSAMPKAAAHTGSSTIRTAACAEEIRAWAQVCTSRAPPAATTAR